MSGFKPKPGSRTPDYEESVVGTQKKQPLVLKTVRGDAFSGEMAQWTRERSWASKAKSGCTKEEGTVRGENTRGPGD